MQTQQCQVPLAMNAVHCAVAAQVETKVRRSAMERNWIDVSRQRTRYYSTVVISVLLPRCGSLASLFYDDILGKTFIDSLFFLRSHVGHPPSMTRDVSFLQWHGKTVHLALVLAMFTQCEF